MASSFSSTFSGLKKLTFSDQFLSSARKKFASPFGLSVVFSFIFLTVILFSFSSKAPGFSPLFQGLYRFSSQNKNSTSLSSPFGSSGNNNTTSSWFNNTGVVQSSQSPVNASLEANTKGSNRTVDSVNSAGEKEALEGAHLGNETEYKNGSFVDYDCSVDFVSSPFLVKESTYSGKNGSFDTLRLDLMDGTTSMYHDADVIIFNTGHWWTHEKTSRGEDYYQEGDYVHPRLKVLEAFKRALATWARWVDKNIDVNKTEVIFRGYSVTHFRGGPWNSGGQCHKETEPIFNETHLVNYPSKMKILEYVLKGMKTPITYLNISRLTDYRKDGHPSIYRPDFHAAQQEIHAQDCSHWCLPGVPDTWNELLYVSLLKRGQGSWRN
ncbi:hypothetical protein STAS_32449 [Striga asiatica]|uniref:Trichome birefringence-like C-terminal domain-containing protein n=1 Tax=Striga asiatica TaxID=4170 RepID=A0A5A7RC16_STRAF|nr:hypothetical protein STAS_32449 [Striga asiatica]